MSVTTSNKTLTLTVLALGFLSAPIMSSAQNYAFTEIIANGQGPVVTTEGYLAINNIGQVVGTYINSSGGYQAYIYSFGTVTPINVPGAYSSNIIAGGINDFGRIVGVYGLVGATPSLQGFSYSGGTFTSINVPGMLIPSSTVLMTPAKSWVTVLHHLGHQTRRSWTTAAQSRR
jgi:hypothetical protein